MKMKTRDEIEQLDKLRQTARSLTLNDVTVAEYAVGLEHAAEKLRQLVCPKGHPGPIGGGVSRLPVDTQRLLRSVIISSSALARTRDEGAELRRKVGRLRKAVTRG